MILNLYAGKAIRNMRTGRYVLFKSKPLHRKVKKSKGLVDKEDMEYELIHNNLFHAVVETFE